MIKVGGKQRVLSRFLLLMPIKSVGVGRMFESVCLFVFNITKKRMIPKCLNLMWGMMLVYPRNCVILEFQGHRLWLGLELGLRQE